MCILAGIIGRYQISDLYLLIFFVEVEEKYQALHFTLPVLEWLQYRGRRYAVDVYIMFAKINACQVLQPSKFVPAIISVSVVTLSLKTEH